MTTIYETYLERVKVLEKVAVYTNEYGYVHQVPKYENIKETLRQSFIAMVEGEIEENNNKTYELRQEKKLNFQQGELFILRDQISRLESELDKLKNNKQ
jgi:hypothetical protein